MPHSIELTGPPRRVTARPVASCDTMVVVRPGQVLFAKNSDRDPNEAQFLDWQPRRVHQAGARLRCTWIEVAQVRETYAVLLSRPFWMWGAEIGANEHGVVIGNEAVFTRQRYARSGLTGMDLLRLALERSSSAGDAVAVITELLGQYGQGGGCGHEHRGFTYHNSFIVADASSGYVLETAGRQWAVEKVEAGARSISNGLTIEPFASQHGDRLRTAVSACRTRQALTQRRAGAAAGPGDLMAALADHGDGRDEPRYSVLNGGMAAPCMHAGGLAASSQTTASWVADLRPDRASHWGTATAAPCTSLFKPVSVDAPLDLGPQPSDRYDPAALWWRHERLHRRVLAQPGQLYPVLRAERDAVQARWLAVPPDPAGAFAAADTLLAGWTAAAAEVTPRDLRPSWVRRYWHTRDSRAGLPPLAGEQAA
jgi:secernin